MVQLTLFDVDDVAGYTTIETPAGRLELADLSVSLRASLFTVDTDRVLTPSAGAQPFTIDLATIYLTKPNVKPDTSVVVAPVARPRALRYAI